MKILVTGGCGFIGSNFVRYWAKKYANDRIVVLDKLTYAGHRESIKDVDCEFRQGDICNRKFVNEALNGIDVVVHFAAESHVDRSILDPSIFTKTNVQGTHNLLEAALMSRVRHFHHVSTDEVFGSLELSDKDQRFNEMSLYRPNSPYSASKAGSDHMVRAYYKTYGLPITVANSSNNYGPYQDPEKLIPKFITNLVEGKKVPLMGRGENIRDWIFVEDHCRATDMIIQAALDNGKIVGETFCVGGNEEKSNLDVTTSILKILNKDKSFIDYVPHRLGHDSRYAIDSFKITSMLGWKPLTSMEESLEKTVSWYVENEWWWKPLKKGRPKIDTNSQIGRLMK